MKKLFTLALVLALLTPACAVYGWGGWHHRGGVIIVPPRIVIPPPRVCYEVERHIHFMGSYDEAVQYAIDFGLRHFKIVSDLQVGYWILFYEIRCN